jgi:hypothetical protein
LAKRLTCDRHASTYLFLKKLGVDLKNYKATQTPRKREGKKELSATNWKSFMCTRRWVMDETPRLIERHPETTILATGINRTRRSMMAKRLTCDQHVSTYFF